MDYIIQPGKKSDYSPSSSFGLEEYIHDDLRSKHKGISSGSECNKQRNIYDATYKIYMDCDLHANLVPHPEIKGSYNI